MLLTACSNVLTPVVTFCGRLGTKSVNVNSPDTCPLHGGVFVGKSEGGTGLPDGAKDGVPQSQNMTGPFVPGAPKWMCAMKIGVVGKTGIFIE